MCKHLFVAEGGLGGACAAIPDGMLLLCSMLSCAGAPGRSSDKGGTSLIAGQNS